jgi:nucleoside-diphosphate-sugar epimerase
MKVLFIGGTGFISTAVSRMAVARGFDLYHLNRGQRPCEIEGVKQLRADIHDRQQVQAALAGHEFDVVVDWIAYGASDIERDLELFHGRTRQFIFISSASAYQKPPSHYVITESTPLANPHWQYSRDKIACEERLLQAYRDEGFPATIVRPSLTYDPQLPVAIGGWGCYTFIDRIKRGRPIIVHGDGSSLWVLTHAEDFAKGFLGLVGNWQSVGHAFHITSDEALTWNQIYATIAEAVGVELHPVYISSHEICRVAPEMEGTLLGDKTWTAIFDNMKIKTWVPGFQAIIPFREGVRRTIAGFEADERRRRVDDAVNQEMDRIIGACGRGNA